MKKISVLRKYIKNERWLSMRLKPKKPIRIRSWTMGGAMPLICIPLVGKSRKEILAEAKNVPEIAPDVIELRIDAWDFVEDVQKSVEMVKEVHAAAGGIPIILTCRGDWEGGYKKVSDEAKFKIYDGAVKGRLVDFIDMELKYGPQKISEVLKSLDGSSVRLIVSFHDFKKTPAKEELISIMSAQIEAGAHVAKLAAMPQAEEDVLTLLEATLAVRRKFADIPIITMSMGGIGAVSRIVGGLYGSDLTFAVGSQASAPGQIPVADLRKCLDVVYPEQ